MKQDRLSAGALAGIIGAVVQNIYGFAVKSLGITDRAFEDFGKVIVLHQPESGIWGFITGAISHLTFGMMLGIVFVYLIRKTSITYLYLKGLGMGAAIWFISLSLGTIYNITLFKDIPPGAALITFVGALLWGLVTAITLKILDQKTNLL